MGIASALGVRPVFRVNLPHYVRVINHAHVDVTGPEFSLFLDAIGGCTPRTLWDYDIDATGDIDGYRWYYTVAAGAGENAFTVRAKRQDIGVTRSESCILRIVDPASGDASTRKILLIGDSTGYKIGGQLKYLFDADNMTVSFVGNESDNDAVDEADVAQTIAHEAHSGYTWPMMTATDGPFGAAGILNCTAYNAAVTGGPLAANDLIYCNLGINDCLTPTTDAELATAITAAHTGISALIGLGDTPASTTLRGAVSGVKVALGLPMQPGGQHGWSVGTASIDFHRYVRNLTLYRKAMIDTYDTAAMRADNIHVIPDFAAVNVRTDYAMESGAMDQYSGVEMARHTAAIHPETDAYVRRAAHLFAWMKDMG